MDEKKVARLIEEVHTRPILWDKTCNEYKNKVKKGHEWSKVASVLNVAKTAAQTKWKALIKTFKSEHNKVHEHKSGDGFDDAYESSWPYYESLTFITNSVIPILSTGNIEIENKSSMSGTSGTENNINVKTASPNGSTMSRKNVIAEQLLQMANEKAALIEKSLPYSDEVHDFAEMDKMNMSFFQTLLPDLRLVEKDKILLCRSEVSRVVHNYAYQGSTWESINDKNDKATATSNVSTKKRYSSPLKRSFIEDDDECQIIAVTPPPPVRYQPNLTIKKEIKSEPTSEKFHVESPRLVPRSNEMAIPCDGYTNCARAYYPPRNYDHYSYYRQRAPEYPGQHNFVSSAICDRYSDSGRQFMPSNIYPPNSSTPHSTENTFNHPRYPFYGNMDESSRLCDNEPPLFQSGASGEPARVNRATIPVDRPNAHLPNERYLRQTEINEEDRLTEGANVTKSSTDDKVTNELEQEVSS